jgi:hypothetical protein
MGQHRDRLTTLEVVEQSSQQPVERGRHQVLFSLGTNQTCFSGLEQGQQLLQLLRRQG